MQTIYDGSEDPVCKNVIEITKNSDNMRLCHNDSNHRWRKYNCTPIDNIINYDYHLLVCFKPTEWYGQCYRIMNKKTGTVDGQIYGPIKHIYYNNCVYIWYYSCNKCILSIFGTDDKYTTYSFPEIDISKSSEMSLLVKSVDNYDLRLVGSGTKIYNSSLNTSIHFDQNGHLVIYCKKEVMTFRGGFEDLSIVI